ncbi:MAG: tRNA dihydrouridine synthase DusB [Nitrospirota bacterium]|nr:tRNA dihydrouridine synthase DusB [Nitrospirota bacterium]
MTFNPPPLSIGGVTFPNALALAPLSGITNLPFRRLARGLGAGMVVSELVSSNGLVRANERTSRYLLTHPDEWPVVMQIFGDDPEPMARAAAIAEEAGAHVVDINIGCPVRKVVTRGAGCALMRDVPRSARIIGAVVRAVKVPVTIKIRAGWNAAQVNAPEYAQMAESEGVKGVTVHGRTRDQMFNGRADWGVIGRTVRAVSIPVIGNGDVCSAADATRMLAETGAAGVMIGRAAQGNPWIFREILSEWRSGTPAPPPTPEERRAVMLHHLALYVEHAGERTATLEMRKHVCWYTKGMRDGGKFRSAVQDIDTLGQLVDAVNDFFGRALPLGSSHGGGVAVE